MKDQYMRTTRFHHFTAALVAGACLVSIAAPGEARERNRSASRTAASGATVERNASVEAYPGYRSAERSASGPNGGSRSVERGYTAGEGAYRSVDVTGANGNTYSREGSSSYDAETGYSSTRSSSGPYGSSSRSVERDAYPGGYEASVEGTNRNGGSYSREVTRSY